MKKSLALILLAWLLFQVPAFLQGTDTLAVPQRPKSSAFLFEIVPPDQPLEMTLVADMRQLKMKRDPEAYLPAEITYQDAQGAPHQLRAEVRARGKTRRTICETPPLKIKFTDIKGGTKTLKIVIPCKNSPYYEQLLLREFVAYRLLNILTDRSFRVQLVKLKFVDIKSKKPAGETFTFFIEHEDEMAARQNGKILATSYISPRVMNNDDFEFMSLFQFMIGNTDWLVQNGHNIKIVGVEGTPRLIFVPYDFDYAGLVSSPYAVPNERLKTRHVTERFYQGLCRSRELTEANLRPFLEKKEALLDYCETFSYLDKKSSKHVNKYMKDFFSIVEDSRKTKVWIYDHCGMWP